MKFTIVTFGSEGDTRPFVALGQGLMAAGHDATLFGEHSSLARARECSLTGQPLAGDVRATLPVIGASEDVTLTQKSKSINNIRKIVNDNTESWLRCIADCARSWDAILYSGLAYCHGEAVAQALQNPGIAFALQPMAATAEFASCCRPSIGSGGSSRGVLSRLEPYRLHNVAQ